MLEWLLRQLNRTLDEVLQAQDSARGKLVSELEVLFHSAEVNRKLYLVFFDFVALGARQERFPRSGESFFAECRRRDTEIVELGIREQQFRRVDPQDAAATISRLGGWLLFTVAFGPGNAPIEGYRDRCRGVLGAYLLR